jgi:uncharacterized membrane protein YeaQ/YmgE (transglycosylase-associated protein family)
MTGLGLTTQGILWIIFVGFVAGIIARFLSRGPNNPTGFVLTTVLGIAGAFLATFIGQQVGWYRADQGAGFITATLGAIVVLFIWNRLVASNVISDPGNPKGGYGGPDDGPGGPGSYDQGQGQGGYGKGGGYGAGPGDKFGQGGGGGGKY